MRILRWMIRMKKVDEKTRTKDVLRPWKMDVRGRRKTGNQKRRDILHKCNRCTERSARPKNGNLMHAPTPNREKMI